MSYETLRFAQGDKYWVYRSLKVVILSEAKNLFFKLHRSDILIAHLIIIYFQAPLRHVNVKSITNHAVIIASSIAGFLSKSPLL
jgi:hypothetical protein